MERFVVAHHPKSLSAPCLQTFAKKGLAFAYAQRKLPNDLNGGIAVERQTDEAGSWKATDVWSFYRDGNVEHARA